jgi:sirohydrochlorin ferrochelatase
MSGDVRTTGVILFAHGSRVEEANQGVHDLARQVEEGGPYPFVRAAFLELAHPDLTEAVALAAAACLNRLIVIPYFLTLGIHLQRDLPNLIAPLKRKYPQLRIEAGKSLEGHPKMPAIILERAEEALRASEVDP